MKTKAVGGLTPGKIFSPTSYARASCLISVFILPASSFILPLMSPVSLKQDGNALLISWDDGATHRLTWRLLRDRCPCAVCQAEAVSKPVELSSLLPIVTLVEVAPLKVSGMRPMGNYAYAIDFSDGHHSGIYSLTYLRQLGDELSTS